MVRYGSTRIIKFSIISNIFRIFVSMTDIKSLQGKELEDFISNFEVNGYYAPSVYTSHVDNQKFVLCMGNPWIPIPDAMTLEDVVSKWVQRQVSKPSFVKEIVGSRGGKYKVTFDKTWKCTCSVFQFKKKCIHIDSTKLELQTKLK